VDFISPNQTEATIITGQPADDAESAARALREKGAKTVVLTLGSRGVLLLDESGARRFPIFKVEPVDTTGAGDAFNGGLAVALAEGQPMADAIRFASATAAISVTRPGATDSMPRRDEVEALLKLA
jgi:ribokinase